MENLKTPFKFKPKNPIVGFKKGTEFLIKDIPNYGNVKVYYQDGKLELFIWMYKSVLMDHLKNNI